LGHAPKCNLFSYRAIVHLRRINLKAVELDQAKAKQADILEAMYDFLLQLQNWRVMEISFIAAVALILIDYFFPVDFPAYIGYFLFAVGMFFAMPFGFLFSVLFAIGLFALLLAMHAIWFSRFLTNAPGLD